MLPYQIWSRCWWKEEPDDCCAAFRYENAARKWAKAWYGSDEGEQKDGCLLWYVRFHEEKSSDLLQTGRPEWPKSNLTEPEKQECYRAAFDAGLNSYGDGSLNTDMQAKHVVDQVIIGVDDGELLTSW